MRYITKTELESLPSYPFIEDALYFGSTPEWDVANGARRSGMPFTRGNPSYVAVQAIYNLSRWESWKSSSLSADERSIAYSIGDLSLWQLMGLNKGRRMNQPALFPEGDLLSEHN